MRLRLKKKVYKNLINKLQLHYLPDERRFHLIEKGKVDNEIKPQAPKGKQGKDFLAIESRQSHLNVVEKIVEDLVFERTPHLDLIYCHFFIVNDFSPTSGMKSFSHDLYCVGKSVGEVRLTRRPQNLIMFDKEFSCETLNLFDRDGNENSLTLSAKSLYICMRFERFERFDCLKVCVSKSCFLGMCDLLVKMKILLRAGTSDQNNVFKSEASFSKLSLREGEHHKFHVNRSVNNICLFDVLSLCLKTKHVNSDVLQSQNQIFDSGGCSMLWFDRFRHGSYNYNFSLLHVPTMFPVKEFPSQIEMVTIWNGFLLKREGMKITCFLFKPFVVLRFLETNLSALKAHYDDFSNGPRVLFKSDRPHALKASYGAN
ncbi:hypothetical protein PVK06_024347 [Gossypium arboreum]|uniref:Uncharacterized protein n=1 Tax=Gossypium arboreum TaxID=29729 RepID=A0ABR0PDY2_GOSAR|nr:hypothetical protein PVK06_024347 [Gossypium arboreum]